MKINIAIHFFLILSFSYTATAQDCLPKGITFTTQKQIDNFLADYPGCTNIKGNVRIEERSASSITNLNSLSQITSIEGNLKVSGNTNLTSLKGLNNLTSIGGQVGIWGNDNLKNINDLENLISINGHLTISNNNSLMNLEGLNKLISIGGFFRVKENNSMASLSGLDHLFSIGKDLWVHNNDNLKNIEGLENLTSIKGSLLVTDNKILKNLYGLNNLAIIEKSLKIENNDSLVSLSVLDNVTSIGGRIIVANNASLIYKNELDKLSSASAKEIKKEKPNINLNEEVKIVNDDPKWQFGAEVGFASVKLKKSERGGLSNRRREEIKRSSKSGFRVVATAKYNIDGQFQFLGGLIDGQFHFIGGLGIIKAKGTADKTTTDSKGTRSPIIKTTIREDIIQNYTLLEMPLYFRCHLFGKHRPDAKKFNIFFDVGGSLKAPLKDESSFTKSKTISTTINTYGSDGDWFFPSEILIDSETTTISSSQEGDLELQSEISGYFAVGILVGGRTSIAFTSSGINTQGVKERSIKYKSRLISVAVTVFF